jgi:hypothetical protein
VELALIKFERETRTPNSEMYSLHIEGVGKYLGKLHIHFSEDSVAYLYLTPMFTEQEVDQIVDYVLINIANEDVHFSVNFSREISDGYTNEMADFRRASAYHVKELTKELTKYTGKNQTIKGKLSEYHASDYLKGLDYDVRMATPDEDKIKIDLVANKDNSTLYAQVKNGQISTKEIGKICLHARNYHTGPEEVIIAIFAKSFDHSAEVKRSFYEKKYSVNIMYIHTYQLINKHPEHKIMS